MKIFTIGILPICLLTNLLICQVLNAQTSVNDNYIPPAPRSRDFQNFTSQNIDMSRGTPNIDIPLYEINLDGVTIPIVLTYNGFGIKFGQQSGDTGLGWNFSPGFRVSRTIRGRPDDFFNKPDHSSISNFLHSFSTPFERDKYLSRYVSPRENASIKSLQSEYLDGEYDEFTLATAEDNSKFIVTDRSNRTVELLKEIGSKIVYSEDETGIKAFDVTSSNGVKYYYGDAVQNTEGVNVSSNGKMIRYNTSWMLSRISTLSGRILNFSYLSAQETAYEKPSYSRSITDAYNFNVGGCMQGSDVVTNTGQSSVGTAYNVALLSQISSEFEEIRISRNTDKLISEILVVNKVNNRTIKKVDFSYTQYGSIYFLDSITITGEEAGSSQHYSFEYNKKDAQRLFYDCFGYYQDQATSGHAYRYDKSAIVFSRICTTNESIPYLEGTRKDTYASTDVYMLNKIIYPTGGFTNYEYECNSYKDSINNRTVFGGGMRIKKITSFDHSGVKLLSKSFSYGNAGHGILMFDPTNQSYYLEEKINLFGFFVGSAGMIQHATRNIVHSSSMQGMLNDDYLRDKFGYYDRVRELIEGDGSNNQETEYRFLIPIPNVYVDASPPNFSYKRTPESMPMSVEFPSYVIGGYRFWNQPQLFEKTIFVKEGGILSKIQQENYEYSIPNASESNLKGLRVNAFARGTQLLSNSLPYDNLGLKSVFNYSTYSIIKGDVKMIKKVTKAFSKNATDLVKTWEGQYIGNQLKWEKTGSSNGKIVINRYKYPTDYSGLAGSDSISTGLKNLVNLNMVTPIIEKTSTYAVSDGTGETVVNSQFQSYYPNKPIKYKSYLLNGPTQNVYGLTAVNSGAITMDPKFWLVGKVNRHDSYGNPLEIYRYDGSTIVYLWGYSGNYPIVKIENATFLEVFGVLGQTAINSFDALNVSDSQILTAGNALRNHNNMKKAMVSSYTYKPLVGMTSKTDPRGVTEFYEYDGMQRLKAVLDQAKNVTSSMDYHYRPN